MKEGHWRNSNLKRAHRQLVCPMLTIYLTTKKSVRGIRRTLQEVKCVVTLETEDK